MKYQQEIREGVKALQEGGIVLHATETCYGLAVDIFNEGALKKLYLLKKMDVKKPVSMMVSGLEQAKKYAEFNYLAEKIAEKFWPGPLTIILKRKKDLPLYFNEDSATVGIRCPDSPIALNLIKGFGGPLTTTSANISGKKEVYDVNEYLKQIGKRGLGPDLIIDSGVLKENVPSTVIEINGDEIRIIREGGIYKELLKFIESLGV